MLKALLLDLDDTLCDTYGANEQAKKIMTQDLEAQYGASINAYHFVHQYVSGIYRQWTQEQHVRYMPIIEQKSEAAFRVQLIQDLLTERNIHTISNQEAQTIQDKFDKDRIEAFNFFPGIENFLSEMRKQLSLVVITNGPEFSQVPKVERINLTEHVDHVIIGGQEPEQKPATSIFKKALQLANCQAQEAIHIGDSLAADIAGANSSGITSVWIQHEQALDADLGMKPTHTLSHPRDIPVFFKNLGSGA